MYAREQFNVQGNQAGQGVGNNNGGPMRPITGRKFAVVDQQPGYQMNQGKSANSFASSGGRATSSSNNSYSSNASTSHVMAPAKSFQNNANANNYQGKANASFNIKPVGKYGNQQENREGNASTSSSLGLMSMPSVNKPATKPATFTKAQSGSQVEDNRNKNRMSGERQLEKVCMLTGSVERVLKYWKIFENQFCLFQVMGSVVSIADGKVPLEKIMLLRDQNKGPILQLTYYSNSTHINIEDFYLGQHLRAVGRMVGSNIMSAFSIRAATPDEMESLHRLCYVSDYSVSAQCGDRPFESKKR